VEKGKGEKSKITEFESDLSRGRRPSKWQKVKTTFTREAHRKKISTKAKTWGSGFPTQ